MLQISDANNTLLIPTPAMGGEQSKKSGNNGEMNNFVKVTEGSTSNIEILLLVQAILLLVALIYQVYKDHKRGWKKRYASSPPNII